MRLLVLEAAKLTMDGNTEIEDSVVQGSKLCAVVLSDRSTEKQKEVINSLLFRGADINFQDANRLKNSVLHCCVEAGNEPVLEFLLKKEIDFSLRNSRGQTALDLAELKKNSNMLRLLRPHYRSGQSIRGEFILKTSIKKFHKDIEENNSRWLKIIKIEKTSIPEVKEFIRDKQFQKFYNTSSHLFSLSFSVKDNNEDIVENLFEHIERSFTTKKPFIIQVKTLSAVKLFYRNAGDSKFLLCIQREVNEEETFETFGDFEKLLQFSLGACNDLTMVRLNDQPLFDNQRLIDLAASSKNVLLLRFLMLFEWDFEFSSDQQSRVMEIAAAKGNEHSIRALLDLPFKLNDDGSNENFNLPLEMKEILRLKNKEGKTPIEIACISGSPEVLRCFVQCGVTTKFMINKVATELSEIAWKEKRVDNLCYLLRADKPFPKFDNMREVKKHSELQKIISERKKLHKLIASGKADQVKKIMEKTQLKFFYDSANTSAIKKAFEEDEFEIVAHLMSLGFKFGEHEESISDFESGLSGINHVKYLTASRKYFKTDSRSFVYHLISHSTEKFSVSGKIPGFFEKLADIVEMQEIMKVLHSSPISIYFDMKSKTVGNIYYHTKLPNSDMSRGLHNTATNEIFIAGDRSENEVLGTLAHELTHMALQQCFQNDCKPYEKYSEEEKIFEKIIVEYERRRNKHPLLEVVFTYGQEDLAAELIVRRNHFIAQFSTEEDQTQFKINIKQFDKLSEFYSKNVALRLNEFIDDPDLARDLRKVQKFNQDHGLFSELVKGENLLREDKLNTFEFLERSHCKVQVISSNYPRLTSLEIFKHIKKSKNINNTEISKYYIFITSKIVAADKKKRGAMMEICRYVKIERVIIESNGLERFQFWKELLPQFGDRVAVLIICPKKTSEDFSKVPINIQVHADYFRYDWDSLDKSKQDKLMLKSVNFQNEVTTLIKIIPNVIEERNKLLKLLPLNDLLDDEKVIEVDSEDLPFDEYDKYHFIHRSLHQTVHREISEYNTKRVKEIYDKAKLDKIMIIADDAGMGKSIILTHLSRTIKINNPSCWIFRKNLTADVLKEFSNANYEHLEKQKTEFEKELLKHCWNSGKVLLFFDGVNEVKLDQKNTLVAIKNISKLPYGQLWLTTRNDFKASLEKELGKVPLTLKVFSPSDQVEFLEKFWLKHIPSGVNNLKTDANNLLKMWKKSLNDKDLKLIGIPLQTRMIAEIYCNQVSNWHSSNIEPSQRIPDIIDLNSLYKKFLNTKIWLWISKNSDSASNESADVMKYGWKRHQQLSVHHQFDEKTAKLLFGVKNQKRVSDDALAKIGLVYVKCGRYPKFAHQTYAEYFIADYVVDQILLQSKWSENVSSFIVRVFEESNCELIRRFVNSILMYNQIALKDQALKKNIGENIQQFGVSLIKKSASENLAELLSLTKKSLSIINNDIQVEDLKKLFQSAIEAKSEEYFNALVTFVGRKTDFKKILFDTPSVFDIAISSKHSCDELVSLINRVAKLVKTKKLQKLDEFPNKRSRLFSKLNSSFNTEEAKKLKMMLSTFENVKAPRRTKRKFNDSLENVDVPTEKELSKPIKLIKEGKRVYNLARFDYIPPSKIIKNIRDDQNSSFPGAPGSLKSKVV